MGRSMAQLLLNAGHALHLHNRTREKAEPLLASGAHWCNTPAAVAAAADVVVTIVGYPNDVEATYFGPSGILSAVRPGAVLIDMTTSKPSLALRIAEAARKNHAEALDAPVSGGDIGARDGRLSIMVGGDEKTLQQVMPILEKLGTNIIHQGGPGAGQHTKMCNQIAGAGTMLGVCEALAYAKKSGLDPHVVLSSISAGAAGSWTMSHLGPRMLDGDFAPGFYIKHFIKDMRIAIEAAEEMELELPGLILAKTLYDKLAAKRCENDGTQALFKYYLDR